MTSTGESCSAPGAAPAREGIARLVELADHAPSSHHTQPWAWRSTPEGLDLYAVPDRAAAHPDAVGRNTVISCGAVLHHLQHLAPALGWSPRVAHFPDGPASPRLAAVRLTPMQVCQDAEERISAVRERRTDRERHTTWPVPEELLGDLARVAARHGATAVAVHDITERFRLQRVVDRAAALPRTGEEVAGAPGAEVDDLETSDTAVILGGVADNPLDWLRTGEALSAVWLRASAEGLSLVPLSRVITVDETRVAVRQQVLGGLLAPHLVLRLGWRGLSRSQLDRLARRVLTETLDPPWLAGGSSAAQPSGIPT